MHSVTRAQASGAEASDQVKQRTAQSVCLNLAEGNAKQTEKERRRFFYIALGSLRETQCILELEDFTPENQKADRLGGSLFKLIQHLQP
ncbi:MAG: four helix bundle protein [Pseudomonadota bacterium]